MTKVLCWETLRSQCQMGSATQILQEYGKFMEICSWNAPIRNIANHRGDEAMSGKVIKIICRKLPNIHSLDAKATPLIPLHCQPSDLPRCQQAAWRALPRAHTRKLGSTLDCAADKVWCGLPRLTTSTMLKGIFIDFSETKGCAYQFQLQLPKLKPKRSTTWVCRPGFLISWVVNLLCCLGDSNGRDRMQNCCLAHSGKIFNPMHLIMLFLIYMVEGIAYQHVFLSFFTWMKGRGFASLLSL